MRIIFCLYFLVSKINTWGANTCPLTVINKKQICPNFCSKFSILLMLSSATQVLRFKGSPRISPQRKGDKRQTSNSSYNLPQPTLLKH